MTELRERLAAALHGTGSGDAIETSEPWMWGSCLNWEPGWGDECSPEKHLDEADRLLRKLVKYGLTLGSVDQTATNLNVGRVDFP